MKDGGLYCGRIDTRLVSKKANRWGSARMASFLTPRQVGVEIRGGAEVGRLIYTKEKYVII